MADAPDLSRFRLSVLSAGLFMALCLIASGVATTIRGNGEFTFYFVVLLGLAVVVALIHLKVNFSAPLMWCLAIWAALHMAGGLVPVPQGWPIHGDQRVLYSWWLWPADGHAFNAAPGGVAGGGWSDMGGWLKYDHVIHAYGFAVTTWACWHGLRASILGSGVRGLGSSQNPRHPKPADNQVADQTPSPGPQTRVKPTLGRLLLCAAAGMGFGALNEVVEFAATLMGPTNVGGYVNTGYDLVANLAGCVIAAAAIYVFDR